MATLDKEIGKVTKKHYKYVTSKRNIIDYENRCLNIPARHFHAGLLRNFEQFLIRTEKWHSVTTNTAFL